MTTSPPTERASTAPVDPRWQRLAQLNGELVGQSDDREVLRVALAEVLDLLGCDAVQVVLCPSQSHSGLVATIDAGVHDGGVQVRETRPGDGPHWRSDARHTLELPGPGDPSGTISIVPRSVLGRRTTRYLTWTFALVLSGSLRAVRALDVERRTAEATYQRVMLDGLTSLGSRSLLIDRGDRALLTAKSEGKAAALLLFDVDDFKRINDTLGHHAGDRVLAEFGLRLRRSVQAGDLAVRLGGDEFAVLTGRLKSPEEAELLAARLLQALSIPIAVDDIELTVRSSAGIAVYGEDGDNVRDLLRAADLAMYAAKGLGSGLWQRYSPSTQALANRWSTLAADLRGEGLEEQLILHYQPQVDSWTGELIGFEALARWEHPELGLVPPREFVLLAERAGLMSHLTISVLGRALADYSALEEIARGCSVSVNISARNLLGRGLVADVARLLAEYGVPAERLTLEVTEPPSAGSPGVTDTLTGLVRLGCRVSVSEFGTGSSSLMALSRYEGIRELKLDSGLVGRVLADPAAERLARAIIGTAHALEVRVVAEGVESRDVIAHLRDLGCDALQGYHVRPPAVLDEIRYWAESWPLQQGVKLALNPSDDLEQRASG